MKWFYSALLVIISMSVEGQGLENVIVERYYISNEADEAASLPEHVNKNSVTYRIYIDMKEGYNLQSVFGDPEHELVIGTTTGFFNHSTYGNYIPNLIEDKNLGVNTVMLDSWIGMGGGSQERYAILKEMDDTLETVVNVEVPPLLRNNDTKAGVPIQEKDGLFKLENLPPRVTQVGLDSLLNFLDKRPTTAPNFSFTTTNGGWGCIGGAVGPDPKTNMVCIGQFTTDGEFYFEFNIQIGSPEYGVEQYFARNPNGNEKLFQGLKYSSKEK